MLISIALHLARWYLSQIHIQEHFNAHRILRFFVKAWLIQLVKWDKMEFVLQMVKNCADRGTVDQDVNRLFVIIFVYLGSVMEFKARIVLVVNRI